jgi:DNA-binding LacI/PurR family transcriptional regulator
MSSIKEVAKTAGVSVTTVSYVLNNKGNISPETRKRVLEAVEKLGYVRSASAKNLRESRARIVGYAWSIAPNLRTHNTVLEEFLHYIMINIEAQGMHLLMFQAPLGNGLSVFEDLIKSRRVDGFIISHTQQDDERMAYLYEVGFPFVAFGQSNTSIDEEVFWVDVDGAAGIYQATEHLIQQGHRRIAMLRWSELSISGNVRFRGYVDALQHYQLGFDPSLVGVCENTITSGYEGAMRLMALEQPPTAVVAVSDTIALGALQAFKEFDQTIAITGFDDMPLAEYTTPSLTSVRQPIPEVAALVVDLLMLQLTEDNPQPQQHILTPELIIRESSTVV